MTETGNATTLEEARRRFKKPFAHEIKVARMTPPSDALKRLNKLSAKANAPEPPPANVTPLARRKETKSPAA